MAHLHTLMLHQLRYGELSMEQERAARAHLESCPDCRARLVRQEQDRRAFELQPVPPAIREAARRGRPLIERLRDWLGGWRPVALAGMAVALALLVVLPRGDDTRTKGGRAAQIEVLVEGEGLLAPGARLQAGDRVQLRIAPGSWRFAWLGNAEGLFDSFEAEPGKATLSPFSLTLDGARTDERIAVVLSVAEIDRGTARRAIAGSQIPGVTVAWVTLPRAD